MAAMANSMALASRLASMAAPSGELRAWEGGGGRAVWWKTRVREMWDRMGGLAADRRIDCMGRAEGLRIGGKRAGGRLQAHVQAHVMTHLGGGEDE